MCDCCYSAPAQHHTGTWELCVWCWASHCDPDRDRWCRLLSDYDVVDVDDVDGLR